MSKSKLSTNDPLRVTRTLKAASGPDCEISAMHLGKVFRVFVIEALSHVRALFVNALDKKVSVCLNRTMTDTKRHTFELADASSPEARCIVCFDTRSAPQHGGNNNALPRKAVRS